jgi:tRNA-uridine 2-sulfurtransferase
MSGGVDSSVAAALVKAAGYEAVGVWMRLSEVADQYSEFNRSCCSLDAAEDARRVASQLDIPFYILNLEREFDEGVLQPFVQGYLSGTTPSPCVDCNSVVKFGALMGRARLLYDCDAVATGHYARVDAPPEPDPAGDGGLARGGPDSRPFRLLRGLDQSKDQSYFLYGLGQDELAHTLFPLGGMPKTRVRDVARAMGLVTADKRDSQEICFVPRGNYRDVLRERAGWRPEPGPVIDVDGKQVGEHFGAASYTIGQRQGTGVALGEPRYVWKIEPGENRITLGRRSDLETRRFDVEKVRFVAGAAPHGEPGNRGRNGDRDSENGAVASTGPRRGAGLVNGDRFQAAVQIRHRGKAAPAVVERMAGDRWSVETEVPVWAAAPGQAAVFYDGDEVIGGGRIVRPDDLAPRSAEPAADS